jgi:hypothetical protein
MVKDRQQRLRGSTGEADIIRTKLEDHRQRVQRATGRLFDGTWGEDAEVEINRKIGEAKQEIRQLEEKLAIIDASRHSLVLRLRPKDVVEEVIAQRKVFHADLVSGDRKRQKAAIKSLVEEIRIRKKPFETKNRVLYKLERVFIRRKPLPGVEWAVPSANGSAPSSKVPSSNGTAGLEPSISHPSNPIAWALGYSDPVRDRVEARRAALVNGMLAVLESETDIGFHFVPGTWLRVLEDGRFAVDALDMDERSLIGGERIFDSDSARAAVQAFLDLRTRHEFGDGFESPATQPN